MPDKPLTIATYAAGASLAAITLVYVFGPTWTLDQDSPTASSKKGVVGLANPANDCFINSVLQALAGLPDLRIYLIREIHRRKLDGHVVYSLTAEDEAEFERTKRTDLRPWKLEGLRKGIVTVGLKEMLDALNERPIYRKTINAGNFIFALEKAFRTRISRQQQDAQEFLQVVAERLCDEYHAGTKARKRTREQLHAPLAGDDAVLTANGSVPDDDVTENGERDEVAAQEDEQEDGFPLEGKMETQVECMTCHFKPKPAVSTFVTLTLNVPEKSSTTLNNCFDGMLKVEHIDDYKCDFCRLEHAIHHKERQLTTATPTQREQLENDLEKLRIALEKDPEEPPKDVTLPDSKLAPSRRIEKHTRIASFPKVLAIHLSRSLYSASSLSTKNTAKVSFPESLPLGGILDQHHYRLLGVVTHKGGHNSGHYESFRRQVVPEPYSTPHSFGQGGPYSHRASPSQSAVQSPKFSARDSRDGRNRLSQLTDIDRSQAATPSSATISLSDSPSSISSQSSLSLASPKKGTPRAPTSAPRQDLINDLPSSIASSPTSSAPTAVKPASPAKKGMAAMRKHRRRDNRWWRISDDKIKESKTAEVLGMQKEVYLLFYELDRRKGVED